MTMGEIDVTVTDGMMLVQRWRCRRTIMPDGAPGVFWRGIAYPLLAGDVIDVAAAAPAPPAAPASRHAVIAGDEASWVLIQGMPAALDAARKALAGSGIVVSRTGRWLGDPVDEVSFDWFLCCEGSLAEQQVRDLLLQSASVPVKPDAGARQAVLEQRIAGLLADVARAEDRLRRSLEAPVPNRIVDAHPAVVGPDPALQNALAEIQALHESLKALGERGVDREKPPDPPQMVRSRDEVAALLAALRPDIDLLADTLTVAMGELGSRGGFYKALAELPQSGGRPDGWKKLRGAERWWERHISTGRNDHARAYARFDPSSRRWSLLLGWKVEQLRDIAWLERQG